MPAAWSEPMPAGRPSKFRPIASERWWPSRSCCVDLRQRRFRPPILGRSWRGWLAHRPGRNADNPRETVTVHDEPLTHAIRRPIYTASCLTVAGRC